MINQNNVSKINDTHKEKNCNKKTIYESIKQDDINSLTKDSPIHLLNALYQCQDYILLDENKEALVNKKSFTYTSSFYLAFLSNQDSLSEEYLQARKSLYQSIYQIKQEKQEQALQALQKQQAILEQSLQNLDSKQKEAKLKDLQRQQEKKLREKQRQKQARLNKDFPLILQNKDKTRTIIFLDKIHLKDLENLNTKDSTTLTSFVSMSNLIHLHNNKQCRI